MEDLQKAHDEIMQSLNDLACKWLEARAAGQDGIASAIDARIKEADKASRKLEKKLRNAQRKDQHA